MYRWQTLTMARVENARWPFPVTAEQHRAVQDFLYNVNSRHFPEPVVEPLCEPLPNADCWDGTPNSLVLIWRIDDRDLWVAFDPTGKRFHKTIGPEGVNDFGDFDGSYQRTKDDLHWILFGYVPLNPLPVAK